MSDDQPVNGRVPYYLYVYVCKIMSMMAAVAVVVCPWCVRAKSYGGQEHKETIWKAVILSRSQILSLCLYVKDTLHNFYLPLYSSHMLLLSYDIMFLIIINWMTLVGNCHFVPLNSWIL